ncbi:conserved protein, unknown function [Hepatocystis sp. ex Piliocolobus tephrosceles]|nr:conserved protein, unknown function [Hepatocystis sp. ex Piliocolobus tephrosceles]
MYREKLEKERIQKRSEKHIKNVVVDNVIRDVKYKDDDKSYLRKKDAEYEDYVSREKQKLKSYMKIENMRKENLKRNENRWKAIEINAQKEQDRTKQLQNMPFKSEKNKSKCTHNIINHDYVNYDASLKIEQKKNEMVDRRRKYLAEKINSSFNPITGEKQN